MRLDERLASKYHGFLHGTKRFDSNFDRSIREDGLHNAWLKLRLLATEPIVGKPDQYIAAAVWSYTLTRIRKATSRREEILQPSLEMTLPADTTARDDESERQYQLMQVLDNMDALTNKQRDVIEAVLRGVSQNEYARINSLEKETTRAYYRCAVLRLKELLVETK